MSERFILPSEPDERPNLEADSPIAEDQAMKPLGSRNTLPNRPLTKPPFGSSSKELSFSICATSWRKRFA
jgi:hypothetical protein